MESDHSAHSDNSAHSDHEEPSDSLGIQLLFRKSNQAMLKKVRVLRATHSLIKQSHNKMIQLLRETFTIKTEQKQFGEFKSKVSVARFDNDDSMVAVGCGDGVVRLFISETSIMQFQFNNVFRNFIIRSEVGTKGRKCNFISKVNQAYLNIQTQDGDQQSTKLQMSTFSWPPTLTDIYIMFMEQLVTFLKLQITKDKILHTLVEEENQIYCCDYNYDGSKFATGGRDTNVRVYDEKKKSQFDILGDTFDIGVHTNRVLSMKFSKEDPNILLTGSWDRTIKVWDLRTGAAVKSIWGPTAYGDCLDIRDGVILVGNYSDEEPIQLYDLGTKKLIENIDWDPRWRKYKGSYITVAQFSKSSSKYILAGSGHLQQIRLYDRKNENKLAFAESVSETTFTVDFSNMSDKYVHGGDGYYLTESKIIQEQNILSNIMKQNLYGCERQLKDQMSQPSQNFGFPKYV